ncbi:MAG: PAS domain S-box protein [Promethearchaeia archaeon]
MKDNFSKVKLLEDCFDAMTGGISILDNDFTILKVNTWMKEKYPVEKGIEGKKCYEVYQHRDTMCQWCPSIKSVQDGQTHSSIVPYPSVKNPVGWIELISYPVKNDRGEVLKIIEYVNDITQRRKAEIKLEETKERLRLAIEKSNLGLWDWNLKTEESIFDEMWANILGYDLRDLEQSFNTWKSLVHPDDLPQVQSELNAHLRGENPFYEVEHRLKTKDGNWLWILTRGKVVESDNEGNPVRITGTHQDITARKLAEKKLKVSEQKFRSLVDHSHVGILIIDNNFKFTYANKQLSEISGYLIEELIGEDFRKFLDKSSRKLVEERYVRRQKGEKLTPRYEFKIIKKNGEKRLVETYANGIKSPITDKVFTIAQILDITERKRRLEDLKRSQEKYKKAYDRAEFYKDLFAHDMNNIFQNVKTSIELLQLWRDDSKKEEERENLIRIVEEQIDRGGNLIANVRKLSILDQEDIIPQNVDLEEMLVNSVNYITKRVNKNNIHIKIIPFPEDFKVLGGDLLLDAFKNVVCNAIIHNDKERKKLIIQVSKEESQDTNWIKIEFQDNGIGIDDKLKKLIFIRNERRDKSKGGLGIGLSLVKKIIDTYHGKIWVEDRVKNDHTQGSNFIILLKRA